MKKLLLAFVLFPLLCSAQRYRNDQLEISQDTIKSSYWQVLKRATTHNPMTTFFRIVNTNDNYTLELKVSLTDVRFSVADKAILDLKLGNGTHLSLYNTGAKKSCMGCGARRLERNELQGVTLIFLLSTEQVAQLMHKHLHHFRLQLTDGTVGTEISDNRSDDFMDAVWLVHTASQLKGNTFY